ncbi:hypothetical protein NQ318_015092 [Aromia moschata]|uniref:Phosphoenolpyruvate synthase n=1 Tax=Aromia moschata TaxID=1265417 RepID=A0AAV8YYD0_9CUCU|nr:hypothetical protein NQ318_015092 [Aromia moschata]
MDLIYYLGFYTALFFIPFVVYFSLFKKNSGRSRYTNRDWFYLLKRYYARKTVKKYQDRFRRKFFNSEESFDEEHSNSQLIYGVDQKGNSFSLKFTLRHGNLAEVYLSLRLADGNHYNRHVSRKAKISRHIWKINGLTMELLEPLRRLRIVFNGLLRNINVTEYEKVEHVRFNFIFNTSGSPTFIPHGMDPDLLAESLTRDTWRDGSWKDSLLDQHGYEQFGALQGFVKGDSYDDYIVNLPAVRSKLGGLDDRFLLNRALRIFLADDYGNLISLVVKSFEHGCSQLNYGSAILSSNFVLPVKGVDILLENIGSHKTIPDMIKVQIEENGCECYSIPAECDMNSNQGRAVCELWFNKTGLEDLKYSDLLFGKKVKIVPDCLVTNIKSEESKIAELAGGKGSSLALLASLNSKDYVVPDGLIVTVNAFKRQLEARPALNKVLLLLDDICCGRKDCKLEEICTETVEYFKKEILLPQIVNAILNEIDNVKMSCNMQEVVAWAVRSSAIGEDSEELSAAGQNETFLGCLTTEEVLRSVTACWASLFTFQSVNYRRQHGLPVLSQMAVVVQKMVRADSAGVLFTWHPSTSNPSQMVITSNFGLGETVVSGHSDPDTFVLNRTWDDKVCLIGSSIGAKNKVTRMTETGVEEAVVEGERWSITEEQALCLGRVGAVLEEAFGSPRDVEWAFAEGRLYLLQARPITTLTSWSEFELTHELDYPVLSDKLIFTTANAEEVFPNCASALSQTTSVRILDRAMQTHAQRHCDPYVSKSLPVSHHRVMIEILNSLHTNVHGDIKLGSRILDLAVFGHEIFDEKIHGIAVNRMGLTPVLTEVSVVVGLIRLAAGNHKTYERIRRKAAKLEMEIRPEDTLSTIHRKIQDSFGEFKRFADFHTHTSSVSVFFQVVAMIVLCANSDELTTDHYSDYALLLSSCEDVVSAEIPVYLERIAKIIREEGYSEEFCTIKPEFGVTWLRAKCPEAHSVFHEFLQNHGHRSLGEFDVMEETWAEDPSKVVLMIQTNTKYQNKANKDTLSVDEMVKKLVTPKNAVTRMIVKFLTNRIRSSVALRELSKSELIRVFSVLKLAYRELARRMVQQGLLPSPTLIYHLTHYEIGQVIQTRNPRLITNILGRSRGKGFIRSGRNSDSQRLCSAYRFPKKEDEIAVTPGDLVCKGTPVCMGTVTGRACVIQTLDEIDQLKLGDVLVTRTTDIGWSPYFPMLSGIVTEVGGLISHGAVVAREYGLPCVVGVKNATKLFSTGDIVTLCGDKGQIGKI